MVLLSPPIQHSVTSQVANQNAAGSQGWRWWRLADKRMTQEGGGGKGMSSEKRPEALAAAWGDVHA